MAERLRVATEGRTKMILARAIIATKRIRLEAIFESSKKSLFCIEMVDEFTVIFRLANELGEVFFFCKMKVPYLAESG